MRAGPPTLSGYAVVAALVAAAALSTAAQTPVVPSRITQAVDAGRMIALRGNTHPWAQAQFDRGAAPATLPMQRMLLVLNRSGQQESDLDALLDQQQDPSSPNFHKWLTPEEFGQKFGPSDQDIQTVTSWLAAQGFTVEHVSNGRTVIEFSGNAAQVRSAFRTEIHQYRINNEDHWANSSDPQIPAALAPVVSGVMTLHNFLKKPQVHLLPDSIPAQISSASSGSSSIRPQVTFNGTTSVNALGPADFAAIYNLNPNFHGVAGFFPRIAVLARSNINFNDIISFNSILPLAPNTFMPAPFIVVNGTDPGDLGGGEEVEAVLDASWAGALAEETVNARVSLVVSASTNTTDGVDLSELYVIDNNLAEVMTESFGGCEAHRTSSQASAISSLAQQAAAQGITYIVSAGDSGAEGCDSANNSTATGPASVNILASTPYTIAVGGTVFNENGNQAKYWSSSNTASTGRSALGYIPENVWNDSCLSAQCGQNANILATGGGASIFFPQPTWQSAVPGIPSDNARHVPDVSFSAAGHDPYLICLRGSCTPNAQGQIFFGAVFGTSASAPAFAGVMALVDNVTGTRQGQANYVLYRLAAAETFSQCNGSDTGSVLGSGCVFNDVTVGNNAVPGEANYGSPAALYQSTVGYDSASGLGSVNIGNLISQWPSARSLASQISTFSLSPTSSVLHGTPITVNITVAPLSGTGGSPTGDVTVIANTNMGVDRKPAGVFTLTNGSVASIVSDLPGGSYNATAHYGGDGQFLPSDSLPISVTVTPEPSTTTVSVLQGTRLPGATPANSVSYGTPLFFAAVVTGSSGEGIPSGNIGFFEDGNLASGILSALNSTGQAFAPTVPNTAPNAVAYPGVGSHAITAVYHGDVSFNQSSSAAAALTVAKASTSAIVQSNVPLAGLNAPVILTARVNTPALSGSCPSGAVAFFSGTTALGTGNLASCTVQTSGFQETAQLTTTQLIAGDDSITAQYAGDQNYNSSASSAVVVTISTTPGFTLSANPTSVTISAPGASGSTVLTFTSLNSFTGSGTLSSTTCGTTADEEITCTLSPFTLPANGTASATLTFLTTAKTASIESRPFELTDPASIKWRLGLVLLLLWVSGISVVAFATKNRHRWAVVTGLVAFAIVASGAACGGGGGGSGGGGSGATVKNSGTPETVVQPLSVGITINGVTQTVPGLTVRVL